MYSAKVALFFSLTVSALAGKISNPYHKARSIARPHVERVAPQAHHFDKRGTSPYLNSNSESEQHTPSRGSKYLQIIEFAVNGSGIPEVNFDAGESYAGTLSIDDNAENQNQLFFWFWPSDNVNATDEIVIWLNGGPGLVERCTTSVLGLTYQVLIHERLL